MSVNSIFMFSPKIKRRLFIIKCFRVNVQLSPTIYFDKRKTLCIIDPHFSDEDENMAMKRMNFYLADLQIRRLKTL